MAEDVQIVFQTKQLFSLYINYIHIFISKLCTLSIRLIINFYASLYSTTFHKSFAIWNSHLGKFGVSDVRTLILVNDN